MMKKMCYVMGIDGGGTKTQVVLADLYGNVITDRVYGSTNPNTMTEKELSDTFRIMFEDIHRDFIGIENIKCIFAGISGAGSQASKQLIKKIIRGHIHSPTKLQIEADTVNALYSGTLGKPGIVQIAGTGSITFGINEKLQQDRVGGWGYLLGDEGSGFDIGQQGIKGALRCEDGRGQRTILMDYIYAHFQVKSGRELIDKIYHSSSPKHLISHVSKLVFQAAIENDAVANRILQRTTKELAHSIQSLSDKLFPEEELIQVILCGGIFTNQSLMLQLLEAEFKHRKQRVNLIIPKIPPAAGAIIGAYLTEDMKEITPNIIENLLAHWKKRHREA
ncbi:N-acetylglucosamine kinase [Ornithinibacillus xuwenensis]|uniref:BadF/BadG/BcrA/BcrD ATPase family protein n=1 Tax=Ornithinibacillus xuwenensis TaxID=3144668 RepID=A0ABU9XK56_9BACI